MTDRPKFYRIGDMERECRPSQGYKGAWLHLGSQPSISGSSIFHYMLSPDLLDGEKAVAIVLDGREFSFSSSHGIFTPAAIRWRARHLIRMANRAEPEAKPLWSSKYE